MIANDFLPRKDNEFQVWANNFVTYLGQIYTQIQFPGDVYQNLNTLYTDFAQKLQIAESPTTRTKAAIQEKIDSRHILEQALRRAIREYLTNNHFLTDPDRDNLGLPIHKTTRTPAPIATTYPEFEVDSGTIRRLIIHYHDQGSGKSKAKPVGQHGVEIRWLISEVPIIDITDLKNSSFDTRTPFTLEFEGHDRGKMVYFCLRWENTRGEKGPWSEIESAIIP
jgi:hypothetical protein